MPKTLDIGNRNRSSCSGLALALAAARDITTDNKGGGREAMGRVLDKRKRGGRGAGVPAVTCSRDWNDKQQQWVRNEQAKRGREGAISLQTSLVELWLKELTDKIKYALYVADSDGRSDLGHNSNLAQSRTERPVAQPGSILLGATLAIFSFSVTHANLLFETFACTAGGGKSGSACGMPTVVGVVAGTPTVTITFPAANAPVTSVSVCVCVCCR